MNFSKHALKKSITVELCEEDHPWNIQRFPSGFRSRKFISLLGSGNQPVQLCISAIKNCHASKVSLFPSRTFSENWLYMLSNFGRSASRASPMRFASSISLERAVALVFCESVLDWAFEFVFFELELD